MNNKSQAGYEDFTPSSFLARVLRWWWGIFLLMMVGAAIGFVLSRVHKPVYESNAVITTSIDFAYAGNLDDEEVDHMLTAVGEIISSSEVMELVRTSGDVPTKFATTAELENGLTASRVGSKWELSCRAQTPGEARQLCEVWSAAAMEELALTRQRSLVTLLAAIADQSTAACLSQSVISEPVSAKCSVQELQDILTKLQASQIDASPDGMLKSLLLSKLSYQLTSEATLPGMPTRYNTNVSILAGAFLGLIAALAALLSGFPRQKVN